MPPLVDMLDGAVYLETLSLFGGDNPKPETPEEQPAPVRTEPFRYAFLALLALNVFLIAGGASFALLYFSR
ncbi:MAG TPA: hypothetical protein VKX25_09750 [Bryobacteraceae bacterium]|nr:hypothetical protein [Bryobacteraceae bacterium]